jgi:hypothetical protein
MPSFSDFITSQRGSEQLLDSDGYIYSRKKIRETALISTWRCSKYGLPTVTPTWPYQTTPLLVELTPTTTKLTEVLLRPQRQEVLSSLKRKAPDQPLAATENLIWSSLALRTWWRAFTEVLRQE